MCIHTDVVISFSTIFELTKTFRVVFVFMARRVISFLFRLFASSVYVTVPYELFTTCAVFYTQRVKARLIYSTAYLTKEWGNRGHLAPPRGELLRSEIEFLIHRLRAPYWTTYLNHF